MIKEQEEKAYELLVDPIETASELGVPPDEHLVQLLVEGLLLRVAGAFVSIEKTLRTLGQGGQDVGRCKPPSTAINSQVHLAATSHVGVTRRVISGRRLL